MKLYTEEQVKNILNRIVCDNEAVNEYINRMTPIELPSDEEIEKMGRDVCIYNHMGWFIEGLKFMRDKIQGGNK